MDHEDLQKDAEFPFTKESLWRVISIIVIVFFAGLFVSWFFFAPSEGVEIYESQESTESAAQENQSQDQAKMQDGREDGQMPGNEYAAGSGRSIIYDFFYRMFGGIEDGLENNPRNLENVDHIDQYNLSKQDDTNIYSGVRAEEEVDIDDFTLEEGEQPSSGGQEKIWLEPGAGSVSLRENGDDQGGKVSNQTQRAQLKESVGDTSRSKTNDVPGTARNFFDSFIVNVDGQTVATLFDVIVSRSNGKTQELVLETDLSGQNRNLQILKFNDDNIISQSPTGQVVTSLDLQAIKALPEFAYDNLGEDLISMRILGQGQVVDNAGNFLSQIDALVYENAQVSEVVFEIDSGTQEQKSGVYRLDFNEATVIKTVSGYDVMLDKEQTEYFRKAGVIGQNP